ncbi:Ubiquitin carboxyl-terminal hydrolase 36 [Geodia barretti]|uniref:Ubiquitin carboxyl-terminal hydrolase 36 n=2 Tax=Geodia barretti TaxID=519541 RepID=A0AA35TMX7_GEOBA|nr:Ubiquitin carboxyl-terminal hydrolase 36 [Geodia barretti]
MTPAQKRFTLHRLPNVLTIQLKRFDYNSLFGGKINKHVGYPAHLDMRPYMTFKKGPPQWYHLYAVLVHSGCSCRSGHYYCYIRNSNKTWYCLNDAQVYQASLQQVLQQEAYLLFYARDLSYQPPPPPPPLADSADMPTTPSTPPSQPKVQPDPNFLGKPVKRPPHLDKTGSPFVKQKPTGIVQPSPHGPSPATPSSSSHAQQPRLSLPLRKSDIDHTPKLQTPPVPAQPPKPVIRAPRTPSFVPRVIAAPSSSKKKKLLQQLAVKTYQEVGASQPSRGPGIGEMGGDREGAFGEPLAKKGGSGEVFIGPLLPGPTPYSAANLSTSPSLKIARVQPQVKPAKPVAKVQPVVHDMGPKEVLVHDAASRKEVFKTIKGLAGESLTNRAARNPKPGWRPLGTPALAPTSPHVTPESQQQTPELKNEDERDSDKMPKPPPLSPPPEVKKRKKRKKKKNRKTDEERNEQRERKHGKTSVTEVERSRKRSPDYSTNEESDGSEDERPRKKRKTPQHEGHWERERKRSRHDSGRSRRHSRSSSSESSRSRSSSREEESERDSDRGGGWHRRGREERKHVSSHREEGRSRHHDTGGKKQHAGRSSHKSKHRSPSPESSRRQRKRHWSLGSDDSHSSTRHKSTRQDAHHATKKKRHSSSHHHHHHHKHSSHHHERIRSSKHVVKTRPSGGATGIVGDVKSAESKSHAHTADKHRAEGGHLLEEGSTAPTKMADSLCGVEEGGKEGRSGGEVPEVVWDFSLKGEGRRGEGIPPGSRWDGSRRDDVIDTLTSHTSNQLGTNVRSWEGGSNSLDTAVPHEGQHKKKESDRDNWDRELDKGKGP